MQVRVGPYSSTCTVRLSDPPKSVHLLRKHSLQSFINIFQYLGVAHSCQSLQDGVSKSGRFKTKQVYRFVSLAVVYCLASSVSYIIVPTLLTCLIKEVDQDQGCLCFADNTVIY